MNEGTAIDWTPFQQALTRRFESAELLALSGRVHDMQAFDRGIARLQAVLPVQGMDRAGQPFMRFAADDAQRQGWLNDMNADGKRSLLLGVRGGYGITRLLSQAPLRQLVERLNASDSLLCGHSDFTALHLALLATALQHGLPVPAMLQGPMLCVDWGPEAVVERTFRDFFAVLADETVIVEGLQALGDVGGPQELSGLLWGGNLSMICALVGTPYMPLVDGGLLFIEDVNEHPYRIERMLLQLHQAGILQRQQALIVGECNDWKASPLDNGYDLAAALGHIQSVTGLPVFTGLRFGHVADRLSLPVGRPGTVQCGANGYAQLHLSTVVTI